MHTFIEVRVQCRTAVLVRFRVSARFEVSFAKNPAQLLYQPPSVVQGEARTMKTRSPTRETAQDAGNHNAGDASAGRQRQLPVGAHFDNVLQGTALRDLSDCASFSKCYHTISLNELGCETRVRCV